MEIQPSPQPKRRNALKTRQRILECAFDLFSAHGYSGTGIRDIAEQAGVASSLVLRYFSNKATLFEESLMHAIYARGFFVKEKAEFGAKMAKLIMRDRDALIPAVMAMAIADPESRAVAKRVTDEVVLKALSEWLGPPDARARALSMLILLNGFSLQTRHLLSGKIPPETVAWFARALQQLADGSDATPERGKA